MTEFHFDPATYLDLMHEEVPAYERLQQAVGLATTGLTVSSVLDLGTGTGETLMLPADPTDAVIPATDGHDRPSSLADQLDWLEDAGFVPLTTWSEHDLVVVRADRPA
jgi:hypothetical protein